MAGITARHTLLLATTLADCRNGNRWIGDASFVDQELDRHFVPISELQLDISFDSRQDSGMKILFLQLR